MIGMPSARNARRFSSISITPVNMTAAGRISRSDWIIVVSLA